MNQEKELYKWEQAIAELPNHVKGVPQGEGFSAGKILIFLGNVLKGLVGLLIAQFIHLFPFLYKKSQTGQIAFTGTADLGLISIFSGFHDWNRLEEFQEFFQPWTFLKKPSIADTWHLDTEFAAQRLNGINPAFIYKCQPEDVYPLGKIRITDEILRPVWGNDINIASALADNRLYILDYKIFENVLTAELSDQLGKYILAPLCLLYVNDKQQLIPLAIQLQQQDHSFSRVFTPQDSADDWLAAKTAIACADISYQGIISHLLNTHLIVETFATATERNLSPQHLLFQLLKPHFFNTFAINNMARNIFLGRGGFFDGTGALGYTGSNELLTRAYSGKGREYEGTPWLFYKQALPYDLEARGVYQIPGYYYRDDALLIWGAIKSYVTSILQLQYKVADDIINDNQLQAWKDELINPKQGNLQGLLGSEKSDQLSGKLNNLEDLIEIVTNVIFTATAQHSAVNFCQYEYAGWIPNYPFAIYQPFSDLIKAEGEKINFVKMLPNRWQSIKQIVLMSTLSLAPPYTSKSLLTLDNPFTDGSAQQVFQLFHQHLQEIENQISVLNTSRSQPYIYLLPSRIAQSIAI
jgi:Lipoxygenase